MPNPYRHTDYDGPRDMQGLPPKKKRTTDPFTIAVAIALVIIASAVFASKAMAFDGNDAANAASEDALYVSLEIPTNIQSMYVGASHIKKISNSRYTVRIGFWQATGDGFHANRNMLLGVALWTVQLERDSDHPNDVIYRTKHSWTYKTW